MLTLKSSKNYIVIKHIRELGEAKDCHTCCFIVFENANVITTWNRDGRNWKKERYTYFGQQAEKDDEITGFKSYQSFYAYCGKKEIERMKLILNPIPIWESYEQLHYANMEFAKEKIYKTIYEFDVNSSFSYGAQKLPDGFQLLKEYMKELFIEKENAKNKITRSKYKNLQNFLVGYFARIKEFVHVRSLIIEYSNRHIKEHIAKIMKQKGICYISNTDSIVTDEKGAEIMYPLINSELGGFKLANKVDKLCYHSCNAYQLGDKITYSGVKYFARKSTDLFKDEYGEQVGTLIKPINFVFNLENTEYSKICEVRYGEIEVKVYNIIGELINTLIYKIGE